MEEASFNINWTKEDVKKWLQKLSFVSKEVIENFEKNEIDGSVLIT